VPPKETGRKYSLEYQLYRLDFLEVINTKKPTKKIGKGFNKAAGRR
jgi:hypothetical protein